ncbi:MAG: hypothetical protein ABJF01_01760 [bacterium]
MLKRNGLMFLAGAAFFALDAAAASAQAKPPTSQKRIPITKEAPGEVVPPAPPRVDTVTVFKTDTMRLQGKTDTVKLTNTVTRVDTVTQAVPMIPRHIGGMYFGAAAGGALPFGAIRTVNEPGALGQLQLGWQGLNNPLGFRADASLTQYAHSAEYAVLGDRPKVWNVNADAKLNLPIFTHTLGSSVIFTPYVIGGASMLRYNNLRMKLDTDGGVVGGFGPQHALIASGDNGGALADTDYHSDYGWNAGGGLSFHAGRKEMFIEARGVHFNHGSQFGSAWHVPVVFGVNLY